MKNRTTNIQLFLTALLLFACGAVLSQDNVHYSSNSDANNPMVTNVKPQAKQLSPAELLLVQQLETARQSDNATESARLQALLDELRGHKQVFLQNMHTSGIHVYNENEFDHNQTAIHNYNSKSHAFAIAPAGSSIAGNLFYVYTRDAQPSPDSIKVMISSNNGTSWLPRISLSMPGYSFNKNELDVEAVFDGTNTWLFAVAGVTEQATNTKKIYHLRLNITASGIFATVLNFPGSGPGMNYYNPRITSDNSNFTSTAHVMLICSMDSLAGTSHYVKQKFALNSSPFVSPPSYNFAQPNGTNGFGWAGNNGTNANSYLYGDIAYYKDDGATGENRIITVYGNYGSGINNLYLAYVSNYSTFGGTLYISEANVNKDVKIAFNGGANNRSGMITYVRQISATNWDIYGYRTTSGGSTAGSWTLNTIDNSSDNSRSCDLIAVKNTSGLFKLCYAQDTAGQPAAFYRSYDGNTWSARYLYSTIKTDTSFAKPRAGYILGGADDGLGFWSAYGGLGGYLSKLMVSTTGIANKNEIATEYSLSQNYPNPFNPVTNINFSLPKSGMVNLIVYDITGKVAAELVNQQLSVGSYTVDFDASHLASGAYFYRLTTDGFTDVKKMMLIK